MSTAAEPRARTPDAKRRVPDFFIVGHHKCGTTALYEMLRRHPDIYMPQIKEPRYLASDMRSRFQPARGHVLPQTLEQYLDLFSAAGEHQKAGEASPSYLYSHTAASNMAELAPAARSIAILREPAEFLRSLHLQLLRSHVETEKNLRKAIALEGPRSEGRHIPRRSHVPQLLDYSDHVRYVEQLRRYHEVFPREQVLVLIYDDFRADNQASLREVMRFLGVEESRAVAPIEVKQTYRAMRSQRLDDVVRSLVQGRSRASRLARGAAKALTSKELRVGALRAARQRAVFTEVPAPDPELMQDLRRRYLPEVVALSEYLDRDLVTLWGYDALG